MHCLLFYVVTMFIDSCKTGKYVRHLLRDSYREGGKVRHTTIGNLSKCTDRQIEAIKWALHFKGELPSNTGKSEIHLRQGLSVGAVITLQQMSQALGIEKALGFTQDGKLALWQVVARIMDQGSRLSAVRLAGSHAACDVLKLEAFCEDDLYENLDWLSAHQQEIENALFWQSHPDGKCDLFLYDVTSTYLEGMQNALAAFGYNRDGKKGKMQLVVGLLCDGEGRPLTIEVFKGNTQDPATVESQIKKVAERFGGGDITFVGDRGMLKSKQVEGLHGEGFHYITAITKPQVETLLQTGVIQLELFDDELAEVFPHEGLRYVLRRNPVRAKEMGGSRTSKLDVVKAYVAKKNEYLKLHLKAKSSVARRDVENRAKSLKIAELIGVEEKDRELQLTVNADAVTEAGKLDGCYVLKTDLPARRITKEKVNERYKDLALVEWAFRTSKTGLLELRPVYVQLESRTRGHALVVMLAYLIVHKLCRLWQTVELTLEGAINELSTLCLIDWQIDGKTFMGRIPEPRPILKKLLSLATIELPKAIVSLGVSVSTRKKLVQERIMR
jgi:proteasome lid subunit RPN8/RPN11